MTFAERKTSTSIPLSPVTEAGLKEWKKPASGDTARWIAATGFDASPVTLCFLPGRKVGIDRVLR